ncbi:pancreatic lipase-related protein 2-like isoform X2 [Ornithodoros turicata]|uniref:pancreatic lipase-related protein 2-like isoform X2 n=1 Tax=Ornithodoros turicata TaxID=34597 RepID=UPI0031388856
MNLSYGWSLHFLVLLCSTVRPQENPEMTKCYDELGCFSTGGVFYDPVHRPVSSPPEDRSKVNTAFMLFTRENGAGHVLPWSSSLDDVRSSPFDASRATKIIVHGFLVNIFLVSWMMDMATAFLLEGDYNVFVVDWNGGNGMPYTQATANCRLVRAEIALLITKLQEAFGVDPMSIHIVGHSLGSHIAGYAGKRINKVGRITGLDPAEPYFQYMPPQVRIDRSDADFVDIIHTDGSPFLENLVEGMGMSEPVGHLDFYPNGGEHMPGCEDLTKAAKLVFSGLTFDDKFATLTCNHQMAVEYFTESIIENQCLPVAHACFSDELFDRGWCADCGLDGSKCAPLGFHADRWRRFKDDSSSVRMFLNTNSRPRYCLFQYFVLVHMADIPGAPTINGHLYLTLRGTNGETILKVTPNAVELRPATSYRFTPTTRFDVGEVTEMLLRYVSADFLYKPRIYVQEVQIRSMNAAAPQRTGEPTERLCPTVTNGIQSDQSVPLVPC